MLRQTGGPLTCSSVFHVFVLNGSASTTPASTEADAGDDRADTGDCPEAVDDCWFRHLKKHKVVVEWTAEQESGFCASKPHDLGDDADGFDEENGAADRQKQFPVSQEGDCGEKGS